MVSAVIHLRKIMVAVTLTLVGMGWAAAPRYDVTQYEARRDQAEAELRDFETLVVQPLVAQRIRVQEQYTYKTERPLVLHTLIDGLERQEAGLLDEIEVCPPQIERLRQQGQAKLESVPVEAERAADLEERGLTKDARKARENANKARAAARALERKADDIERKLTRKESQLARKRAQLDDLREELDEIVDGQPSVRQLQFELRRLETRLGDLDKLREEKRQECQLWHGIVDMCRDYNRLAAAQLQAE